MAASNLAAVSLVPKGDLIIQEVPMYEVHGNEILIKVFCEFMLPANIIYVSDVIVERSSSHSAF
jgi:hypothetical protein